MPDPQVLDENGVRWIVLNRPGDLNALKVDDITAATEAVRAAAGTARCLVLTGAGRRAFSSGMHLDSLVDLDQERARALMSRLAAFVGAVRRAPIPTVAAIRGYCLGGAFELALACDLRVVATDAVFGLPEIKLGIPSVIDAALLQQHVGLAKAKEMILTGDLYDVAALRSGGVFNQVTSPESLEEEAGRLAARVGGHTRTVLAAQKDLFECWQNMGLREAVERSVAVFANVFVHGETRQRIAAYRARQRR
ncbi:MAG: enoyl-CoA hydratase-related protein [Nocardioidaceae bacterium]